MISSWTTSTLFLAMLLICCGSVYAIDSLVVNPDLKPANGEERTPEGFELSGDVAYGDLSSSREHAGYGVQLHSAADLNGDGQSNGEIRTKVRGITSEQGRWYRLLICGLAQPEFSVEQEDLYLKVVFAKDEGRTTLDFIKKTFYAQIEMERSDLRDKGTNKSLGPATWRTYAMDFRTPFPEVDALELSAGFAHGNGQGRNAEFWINHFELFPISAPEEYVERKSPEALPVAAQSLAQLGGRWYFNPKQGTAELPAQFDHRNVDQLLYLAEDFIAPFAQNTSAWLRKGYVGADGKLVGEDKFVEDNVVIRVTGDHLVIRSRNLPNHPTAVFPDRWRTLDGNPNYIAEQDTTWYIPLAPRENLNRVAMKNESNTNHALPPGPIGVAVNGIVFFNPFDHLLNEDAVWRLDRCCGHPAPNSLYHYHKYPVCVKSPWTDDGQTHSPVIGFAFDGYPVYGPYEGSQELARDSQTNPLNEFNVHFDQVRGWHYHVTPGAFPHIIGGYWGIADSRNLRGAGGPPPGPGGPPRLPPGPRPKARRSPESQ